jgi:carboxyl-terminal processing protease
VNYAQQLVADVITPISEHYVRAIPREELIVAALAGMYEAAQVSAPKGLADEVTKADGADLLALIARTRATLGDIESLRGSQALLVSIRAVLAKLDPYSGLVKGDELRRGNGIAGEYGIGLEVAVYAASGELQVKSVSLGGPAQKAGIRPGDYITHINGKPTAGLSSLAPVVYRPGGEPVLLPADGQQSRLELTLQRPGTKTPRKVTLSYESFRPESVLGIMRQPDNGWDCWADRKNKIAHVRIATLIEGTSGELEQALQDLQSQGMRALILDLRWCPGGSLIESINVASLFIEGGAVAKTRARNSADKEYTSEGERHFLGFPIVVLVNGDTSGGAELIAAAIQDHHRGVIVGQRTRGKASIQTLIPLPVPDTGLKLTNGMFIRPSGKSLHRFPDSKHTDDWGVRPEPQRYFPISPELSKQLRDWWQLQSLRPASCNEALPLDDPACDPQRQYALRVATTLLQ